MHHARVLRNKKLSLQHKHSECLCDVLCSKHSKMYYIVPTLCLLGLLSVAIHFRMPCIATRHDRVDTLPSDFTICVLTTDFILLSARLKIIIVFFQGLVPWALRTYSTLFYHTSKKVLPSLR